MKKTIAALCAAALMLSACSSTKNIGGKEYQPYGIATSDNAATNVCYSASASDVILSLIFIETFIVPVYLIGWDVMEPSGVKTADGTCQPA